MKPLDISNKTLSRPLLTVTPSIFSPQHGIPLHMEVHIDHGGAVLKWAEGINEKAGCFFFLFWGGVMEGVLLFV